MSSTTPVNGRPPVAKIGILILAGGALLAAFGFGYWTIKAESRAVRGHSERSFVVNTDFDKFRKIMVRKNATAAIVSHSGMELIDEQLEGVKVDTTGDDRPLRNVLRGRSQSELDATKQIVVSLNNPALDADRLSLTQQAEIEPSRLSVRTTANQPAGNLEEYETTLVAEPDGNDTRVQITVDQLVRVDVPRLFLTRAESRVQAAADETTRDQELAITAFIDRYKDQIVVLPEFGGE